MKILIAVDGSEYTKRMLAYIAANDGWLGPQQQFTVFHCVLALPHRAAAFVNEKSVLAFYDDDAETVIKPIRQFFKLQAKVATFRHEIGAPAEHIAKLAMLGKFDLLILGSHGYGAIANVVLGSVATKVLALCSTPVLLVR